MVMNHSFEVSTFPLLNFASLVKVKCFLISHHNLENESGQFDLFLISFGEASDSIFSLLDEGFTYLHCE